MLKQTFSLGLFTLYILILSACNLAQESPEVTATADNTITPFATLNTATATSIPSTQTATETTLNIAQIPTQSERSNCVISQTNLPVYIVQAGDTLSNLASRATSTVSHLAELNCLDNTSYILVGQQLIVPNAIIAPTTSTSGSQSNASNPPQDPSNNDSSTNTTGQPSILQPSSFDAQPRSVSRGGTLTISWHFNRDVGNVEIGAEGVDYRGRLTLASGLPSSGTTTVSLPDDNSLFLESAKIWVSGNNAGSNYITIQIECPFVPLYGTSCPQYGADNANIVYQQFENGFMISYNETVIIASNNGFVQHVGNIAPEPEDDTFPTPDATFILQWLSANDSSEPIYEVLGNATNEAQHYTGTWQRLPNLRSLSAEYVTLPDSRILVIDYFFGRPTTWQIN